MKKAILLLMLAGSVSALQSCSSGAGSTGGADSVINNHDVPSNRDTSKTETSIGGASLLDYTGSGGITMPKGTPSARKSMAAPTTTAAPVAAADTAAKADSTKK
ncbi:hypothetical protein [Mucilaginibacter aquatilis]|uniref:Coproporphyrinogen III oxidase n=1 Tax=Mucilaginibacter aquatilis TaxID=1517760 RepID=A0A6I4I5T4_9SPHI|nr:hypothetical protein [Mucilaginibacter aquatilis]MVN89508.1 hypothetical protein [Mucilaginibacter aquatilis]